MIKIKEGEKRKAGAKVISLKGQASPTVTSPLRRILDSSRVLVSGFDWAAATYDSTAREIYHLFDSTAAGLTAVGTYYVQLKATIGSEVYAREVTVVVEEWGP